MPTNDGSLLTAIPFPFIRGMSCNCMNPEEPCGAIPGLCARGEYSLGADTASKQKKETASLSNPLQVMWMTADNWPIRKKQVSLVEVCIIKISPETSSTCLQKWDCRGIVLWILTFLVGESGQVPIPLEIRLRDEVTCAKAHKWPAVELS